MNDRRTVYLTGAWDIDVPLSEAEYYEDMPFLNRILAAVPDEVTLMDAHVVVHGRSYRYKHIQERVFG